MRRVLCAGHVNWDVTLRVDRLPAPDGEVQIQERRQAGGGSAANVASTLSSLAVDADVFGSVGEDDAGRLARRELARAGVDCTHLVEVSGAATVVKYLIVDGTGEVMVLGSEGANEEFGPEDLPADAFEGLSHLHLTSQRPKTAAALADRANEAGVTVSFDPGRRFGKRNYRTTLRRADVLFLNKREAAALVNGGGFEALARDALVVITRGSDGAEAQTPDGSFIHPGFAVNALDTTGAGDAFTAGFLAALFEFDGAYERALAVANACGALASLEVGARFEPTWAEVKALLDDRSD